MNKWKHGDAAFKLYVVVVGAFLAFSCELNLAESLVGAILGGGLCLLKRCLAPQQVGALACNSSMPFGQL